jgi:hypothetical protein
VLCTAHCSLNTTLNIIHPHARDWRPVTCFIGHYNYDTRGAFSHPVCHAPDKRLKLTDYPCRHADMRTSHMLEFVCGLGLFQVFLGTAFARVLPRRKQKIFSGLEQTEAEFQTAHPPPFFVILWIIKINEAIEHTTAMVNTFLNIKQA